MRYRLLASPDYNRKLARFLRVHPDIKPRYARTIELLELNPFHPSLRLHKLSGALEGLCSFSINLPRQCLPPCARVSRIDRAVSLARSDSARRRRISSEIKRSALQQSSFQSASSLHRSGDCIVVRGPGPATPIAAGSPPDRPARGSWRRGRS